MDIINYLLGRSDEPEPVPALEAPRDAVPIVPEPSILEREQMEIDAKRVRLVDNADCYDAAVYYHEQQASIFRAKKADTLRILNGLDQHEAVISAKLPDALEAVSAEIDTEIENIILREQIAHEAEKNIEDRKNGTDRRPKRGRQSINAMIEAE